MGAAAVAILRGRRGQVAWLLSMCAQSRAACILAQQPRSKAFVCAPRAPPYPSDTLLKIQRLHLRGPLRRCKDGHALSLRCASRKAAAAAHKRDDNARIVDTGHRHARSLQFIEHRPASLTRVEAHRRRQRSETTESVNLDRRCIVSCTARAGAEPANPNRNVHARAAAAMAQAIECPAFTPPAVGYMLACRRGANVALRATYLVTEAPSTGAVQRGNAAGRVRWASRADLGR
jgi:hypothetical protein